VGVSLSERKGRKIDADFREWIQGELRKKREEDFDCIQGKDIRAIRITLTLEKISG